MKIFIFSTENNTLLPIYNFAPAFSAISFAVFLPQLNNEHNSLRVTHILLSISTVELSVLLIISPSFYH